MNKRLPVARKFERVVSSKVETVRAELGTASLLLFLLDNNVDVDIWKALLTEYLVFARKQEDLNEPIETLNNWYDTNTAEDFLKLLTADE